MGLNILITGGTGCIGSETTKVLELSDAVEHIYILSRKKIQTSKEHPKVIYVQADLYDLDVLTTLLKEKSIHRILHAAAIRTSEAQEKPLEAFEVNTRATSILLEAARLTKIERFVFISTAAVYGDFDGIASEETPLQSNLPYIASKIAAENICECYAKNYGLPICVIRPQIIYGPSRLSEGSTASITKALFAQVKGENFKIQFKGPHAFHFTEDVGRLFGMTLLAPFHKNYGVYNLPGESFNSVEYAKELMSCAEELELKRIQIDVEEKEMPFPSKLIYDNFFQDFEGAKITPLRECLLKSLKSIMKKTSIL